MFVSSNGDVPFTKMAGSFDAVTPPSKLPMEPRIASEPSEPAFRPHARLAFVSALSSQMFTSSGRPSEHLRLTASTAASRPVRVRSPPLPSGLVNAMIDVNFSGAPGHGFDGAVVPDAPFAPLLELLPLHAATDSAKTVIRHTPRACTPSPSIHELLPQMVAVRSP